MSSSCTNSFNSNEMVCNDGVSQSLLPMICSTSTLDYTLTDEEYRRFIKVKILYNLNDFSYTNIQCILDYLFDGAACVVDMYSSTTKILFNRCLTAKEKSLLLLYARVIPTQLFNTYQFLEVPENSQPVIITCDPDSDCAGGGFVCDPNDTSSVLVAPVTAPCFLGDYERLALTPQIKSTPQDIYLFQGQAVSVVNIWKDVELYGEVPIYSLSGQPSGVYIDTSGNLKGYVRHTNNVGTYATTLTVQTSAGVATTTFNIFIENVNTFDSCTIKPSLVLEKYENAPAKVTLGYQSTSNGNKESFDIYGENLRTTTQINSTSGEEEIIEKPIVVNGVNLCSFNINMFAKENDELPDTKGNGEYEIEVCFEGNTTNNDPFTNLYTGNNKYNISDVNDKSFDITTNVTRYGISVSANNLPCGLQFGLDIAACFGGSLCETITNGVSKIGNTSILDKDDNIPGFESLTFGFV